MRHLKEFCSVVWLFLAFSVGLLNAGDVQQSRSPYHAYTVGAGHVDSNGGGANADVVVPLWSNDNNLFFTDLRSRWNSSDRLDFSAGLAFRHLTKTDEVFGGYVFFDHQNSEHGYDYQQGVFGLEYLTLEWEVRANAYISTRTAYQIGPSHAVVSGGHLLVVAPIEAAYATTDFELGALLTDWMDGAIELRGFAGGYYAQRDVAGFDKLIGPRLRTELRLYGLPWLGHGARLMVEGLYQWDEVRGSQGMASLGVRVPLSFGERRRPTRIERRMLDRIVRSPGILTETQNARDLAVSSDGDRLDAAVEIDANTPNPAEVVARLGEYSLVAIDGSAGDIELTQPLVMNNYQMLIGSGITLDVKGAETGLPAVYVVPGTDARLVGTNSSEDVIVLPKERGIVVGLDIEGGRNGIAGEGASDFAILGSHISGAHSNTYPDGRNGSYVYSDGGTSGNGISLRHSQGESVIVGNWLESNDSSGLFMFHPPASGGQLAMDLVGNISTGNGQAGFLIGGDMDGNVTGNYFADNHAQGLIVGNFSGNIVENEFVENGSSALLAWGNVTGDIADNSLRENHGEGILVNGNVQGNITRNDSNRNEGDGIRVTGDIIGDIVENDLSRNVGGGFLVDGNVTGRVSENSANKNSTRGISVTGDLIGTIAENTIWENGASGIEVQGVVQGSVVDNYVRGNEGSGILLANGITGDFSNNESVRNVGDGIEIQGHVAGILFGNITSRNQSDGIIVYGEVGGDVIDNFSERNGLSGIEIRGDVEGDIRGNTSRRNNQDGITIMTNVRGDVAENIVSENRGNGIYVDDNVIGNVLHNITEKNDGDGILIINDVGGDIREGTSNRNRGHGIFVGGDVYGGIGDNLGEQNDSTGLRIQGQVEGSIIGNNFNKNDGDGISIEGAILGSVLLNDADQNEMYGVNAMNGVRGDVTGNKTHGNGISGLRIWSFVKGDVVNNEAIDNGANGIEAYQVEGDVLRNRAFENGRHVTPFGGDGLRLGGWVRGEVLENEVRDNRRQGIHLILRPHESVFLRENLLVGNNDTFHELWVENWGAVNGPAFVTLKDNISRNDLSGGHGFDYQFEHGANIEFIDAGGNIGTIEK